MSAVIRRTEEKDLPEIGRLYALASAALRAQGVDQWQDGYPGVEDARADMLAGNSYVLTESGRVIGTACIAFGREPTYERIDGAWAADLPVYGFLHRIAVDPAAKGRGAAGLLFDELKRQARARGIAVIRGDTHRDNLPMRRALAKAGLAYRGTIRLENGDERVAYEGILE